MSEDEALDSIIEFSENLEDAEAPAPIPKADYEAEIMGANKRESNTTGNRYADVVFNIPADQFPADWEDAAEYPDGLQLHYRRVSLEDNKRSRYNLKRFAENIGAPLAGKRADLSSWIGCRAMISIDHQPDLQGLPRAEVVMVKPLD